MFELYQKVLTPDGPGEIVDGPFENPYGPSWQVEVGGITDHYLDEVLEPLL